MPALFVPWSAVLLDAAALRMGEGVRDVACGKGTSRRVQPNGQIEPPSGSSWQGPVGGAVEWAPAPR